MHKENVIAVPLAQDGLDEDEIEMVCSIFRSGNLTMGKAVREFEQVFAKPQQPINEPYFSAIDKALILKRRAIRSLRSRFSHLCQETPNSANTEIHQSNYN
jgi:dTDP-4-amino-4,6-dideoxygalactose transaminase